MNRIFQEDVLTGKLGSFPPCALTVDGILKAGAVVVPLNVLLKSREISYHLQDSEAKAYFCFEGTEQLPMGEMGYGGFQGADGCDHFFLITANPAAPSPIADAKTMGALIAGQLPTFETVQTSSEDTAVILYTSGSTGKPKGAMMSFSAMHKSARGICEYLKTRADDRMLSYLPLAHAFERFIVESTSLYAGFPLYFAESLDTFLQDLQRARPTLFISVPRLWLKFQLGVFQKVPPKKLNRLLKIPILRGIVKKKILTQLGLNHVRFAGSASAPIPKEIIEWYRNLGLELLEGYGMTENMAYSHCTKPGEVRPGYVGPPYPDVQQRISEDGEILVKSPGNMTGYYKMPEKTAEEFTEDGFFKTGDMGEIDEKGRLKITGRLKELFKTSKGKYVAPVPIENLLANHPRVEACCVTGVGYPQPYGVVMLSEDARGAIEQAGRRPLKANLPST